MVLNIVYVVCLSSSNILLHRWETAKLLGSLCPNRLPSVHHWMLTSAAIREQLVLSDHQHVTSADFCGSSVVS